MTIALLRFPFLVQKQIFEEIDLLSVLSITMLSKKSHATARACLRHHNYHLRYVEDQSIRLERKFEKEDGHILILVLIGQTPPPFPFELWRIGNQEIAIESTRNESRGTISTITHVYSDNILDFATETLQYLSRLLPKLSVTLELKARSVESFRKTMKSVESASEIKEINVEEHAWNRDPVSQNEFVKLVLDECQQAKKLCIIIQTPDNFEYPTSVQFKFDSISMVSAEWVSRDHFIKLFLSCKKVQLYSKNFNDEDLAAIFKAWTEGSSLEYLEFVGLGTFYRGKTLNSSLEVLPGAAPVKNALIQTEVFTRSHVETFGEGKCCLIQQNDKQKTALVCINYKSVILTTDFKIGKEVDEMAARIEEEERLRQNPIDENLEVEED
ncbi:unnamed protein product [Caenorhabditis brenneri]